MWADEFDEDGSISLDRWTPETIPPVDGCCWYNGEFQFYTDKSDNVKIEDGLLKITAKKETPALNKLFKKLTKNLLRIECGYKADIIYRL